MDLLDPSAGYRATDFLPVDHDSVGGPRERIGSAARDERTVWQSSGFALRKPYWIKAPSPALKLVLGEMSALVLEGQRVLPAKALEAGFKFQFETIEAALRDLLAALAPATYS